MPVSTLQTAMMPTSDPMVGRIVGSIMARQKNDEKPEQVVLQGKCSSGAINLQYVRQGDGQVAVDGFVGSVEVHDRIEGQAQSTAFFAEPRVFGQVGSEELELSAQVKGANDKLGIAAFRSSRDIAMSDELRAGGREMGGMGIRIGVQPTFGGSSLDTHLAPGRVATESDPIETTDDIWVYGKSGGNELVRRLTWQSATWSVTGNNREGFAEFNVHLAEKATETISIKSNGAETRTEQPLRFSVSGQRAEAHGTLLTTAPGAAPQQTEVAMTYEAIPQKGAVKVTERFNADAQEFVIFPKA